MYLKVFQRVIKRPTVLIMILYQRKQYLGHQSFHSLRELLDIDLYLRVKCFLSSIPSATTRSDFHTQDPERFYRHHQSQYLNVSYPMRSVA